MKALFVLIFPVLLFSQTIDFKDTLITKNGDVYVGTITELDDGGVEIRLSGGLKSEIEIKNLSKIILENIGEIYDSEYGYKKNYNYYQKNVIEIRTEKGKSELPLKQMENRYRPGDHEVMMMPTAYTMEKGQSYITDYELFVLNYTYGITSRTHISALVMFPIMAEFYKTFSFGIKQNYWRSEYFSGALYATYMPLIGEEQNLITFGNVLSIGNMRKALHIGIGAISEFEHIEPIYMLGGTINLSKMVSLLVEYSNTNELLDNDFIGLLSFGIRFRSGRMAWELGGIRPLADTGDSFIMFPWLKATLMLY